jgi:hypothetical protein
MTALPGHRDLPATSAPCRRGCRFPSKIPGRFALRRFAAIRWAMLDTLHACVNQTDPMRPVPSLLPFLFVFLWSTGFIGAKYGLPYAEPLSFPARPLPAGHRRDGHAGAGDPRPLAGRRRASGCTSASPACWCTRSTSAASSWPSSHGLPAGITALVVGCSRCSPRWAPAPAGRAGAAAPVGRAGAGLWPASGWWSPTRWPQPPARRNSPPCSRRPCWRCSASPPAPSTRSASARPSTCAPARSSSFCQPRSVRPRRQPDRKHAHRMERPVHFALGWLVLVLLRWAPSAWC